jgi:DNA-binding GntR family transcriptional regulator
MQAIVYPYADRWLGVHSGPRLRATISAAVPLEGAVEQWSGQTGEMQKAGRVGMKTPHEAAQRAQAGPTKRSAAKPAKTALAPPGTGSAPSASGRKAHLRITLEEEIASGMILPGARLDEAELCERFGVSRTPVREALLQLASLGLVQFRPRHGATVARLSLQEIVAMWEVLTAMESFGTSLAARRMDPSERERLVAAHEASREWMEADDAVGYERSNRTFHDILYGAFRNPYLTAQVSEMRRRLRPYGRYPFQRPGGIRRSFSGHQQVVDAILAGNDEAAGAAMREHISGGLTFLEFIAELPSALTKGDSEERSTSRGDGKKRIA